MASPPLHPIGAGTGMPVTEADLHAYADRLLEPARHAEIEAFLDAHPAERERVRVRARAVLVAWATVDTRPSPPPAGARTQPAGSMPSLARTGGRASR